MQLHCLFGVLRRVFGRDRWFQVDRWLLHWFSYQGLQWTEQIDYTIIIIIIIIIIILFLFFIIFIFYCIPLLIAQMKANIITLYCFHHCNYIFNTISTSTLSRSNARKTHLIMSFVWLLSDRTRPPYSNRPTFCRSDCASFIRSRRWHLKFDFIGSRCISPISPSTAASRLLLCCY